MCDGAMWLLPNKDHSLPTYTHTHTYIHTYSCYQLFPKPRWAGKPAPTIRCGQCAQWIPSMHTLRFVAEEDVEAGQDVTLSFLSAQLALKAPLHGLAADDSTVVIMHSNDVRDVGVRDKERAICKIARISPATQKSMYCVPPADTQFQPDPSVAMYVSYKADTFKGPTMGSFKVAPVDSQETEVPPSFEVASPMLTMVHSPDVHFESSLDLIVPVNKRIMDWYAEEQTELSLAGLEGRRQMNAESGVTMYTHLWLHWFNSQTLSWMPIKGSQVRSGQVVASLPTSVLNNPAFSGKVANMLVTNTDPPENPLCTEFQRLVGGE